MSISAHDLALFARGKQRSMTHTPARRDLAVRLQACARDLPAKFATTAPEPCLANKRCVADMWLYSQPEKDAQDALAARRQKVELSSPFALDVRPFHSHLCRFIRLDEHGVSWGLLLHRKARADRENLAALLDAFEGDALVRDALAPFADAQAALNVEAPQAQKACGAADLLPRDIGSGWCLWWSAEPDQLSDQLLDHIGTDLVRLTPLITTIGWRPDNDRAGLLSALKADREQSKRARFKAGERIRITGGMFAGRMGRVESQHDNGTLSVAVGPVAITVKDDEVSPL
jgi:hypothetical protein